MGRVKRILESLYSNTPYDTINDAGGYTELLKGKTKIWYLKKDAPIDLKMGMKFLKSNKPELIPTRDTIQNTHVMIGSIAEIDLDKIYKALQGENWSPLGQAKNLIKKANVGHTSMSIGDLIEYPDGQVWMVDRDDFSLLFK